MTDHPDYPRALQAALSTPPLERKGWQTTIAPSYIGLFLWVVYFDRIGCRTLPVGGLGWTLLGVAAGSVLCYLLLYLVPALWGQRTGWPSTVLGGSTFGTKGTVWLLFGVFGLAQVVWLAVATFYSVDWTFQGLSSCGLLDAKALRPALFRVGPGAGRVVELRSPLFLITSLAWLYAAALVGHYLVRIIQALMNVYPIFPALMLGLAMVWTIGGVPGFQPLGIDPVASAPVGDGGPRAFLMAIQMVLGFFAMAGVTAADWGAVNRTPQDIRRGGLVGVAFASWTVATLALLTVAGALGRYPAPPPVPGGASGDNFTYRVALLLGLPERLAGVVFLIFGLSSLAPTCYAAFLFGHRFAAVAPQVSRVKWTLLGTTAAWPLIATGLASRLESLFTLLGAVFAPMIGAMASDYVRARGSWPGLRRGVNVAGITAWACGLAVGLVPLVVSATGQGDGTRFQPAAAYALVTAFLVHWVLAALGLEPPVLAVPLVSHVPEPAVVPEPPAGSEPEAGSGEGP